MEIGPKLFFLARQKGTFLKQIAKDEGFKIIEVAIMFASEHHPGVSQEEIRDKASFDEASIARSLKSLEDRNLIIRKVNPENKRLKKVFLTKQGFEITASFKKVLNFWDDELLSSLTMSERENLGEILDKAIIEPERLEPDSMLSKWKEQSNE
ncbi:hypothetical protein RD055328_02580 [Companilactobacillus sp. RD055328]|uniref:MarR family winged helix-turn-helix transcriptional regulator n=1 Tax=Companilactobacillus sp. RD055328 TaxID=2916634 RepID=UPI001FC8D150|nr:MarR family transcriptional regulator [Companilactobacillus sp. RD055328]GKQ42335.1 hypothetical protein RD055328_02580 [Companilactobacillus sp. RD055328]